MTKWRLRVLLAALFIGGLWLLASSPASASSAEESCFTSKVNSERTSRGIPALTTNGDLVAIARRHSQRMANSGSIYHNGNLANEAPSGWKSLGENVGVGPSCTAIHQAFMNSASHRSNILDSDYNQIGVGVVITGDGTIYVTEVFMQKALAAQTTTTTPPKTTTTTTTAKKTTTTTPRPKPVAPAPAPPPPPPPPPPGSKVTGTTRNYFDAIEKEFQPTPEQQAEYANYLKEVAEERAARAQREAERVRREHNLVSRLASFVAGALSAVF